MKKHKLYFAPCKDGTIEWEHEGQLERIVRSLKPKRHVMEIYEYKRNRSAEQNRYYFGVVCKLISEETGYTPDEVHQLMAERFLGYEKDGHAFVRSTTTLNTAEMEEYLSAVRMFASQELSCYVPLPNECHFLEGV